MDSQTGICLASTLKIGSVRTYVYPPEDMEIVLSLEPSSETPTPPLPLTLILKNLKLSAITY